MRKPSPLKKNSISTLFAVYLVAFFTDVLPATEVSLNDFPNDLQAYLQQAQSNNPELKAFHERYEAATERIPQVRSLPDPTLQITQFVESVQTRTGPQEQVLMLNQKIPWFGKLGKKEAAVSAEAEAVWYAFQAAELKLLGEVADAYFEYAYTGKAISLTQQNFALLDDFEPIVEERVRGGGDLNPLLRLKVELGKMEDRLHTLKESRIAQNARLNALLGIEASDDFLPWPEWEAPEWAEFESASLDIALEAGNPELAMLERKVASAEARHQLAKLEALPDFSLGINYIHLGDPLDPTTPDAGQNPWGVTFSMNLPLWHGKIRAQQKEALSSKRAESMSLENRRNHLKAELSIALSRHQDAQRQLKLFGEELLELARQSVEITQTSYESGRSSLLDVIDSERSLLDLDLQYWRAAANAWKARISMYVLIGTALPKSQ